MFVAALSRIDTVREVGVPHPAEELCFGKSSNSVDQRILCSQTRARCVISYQCSSVLPRHSTSGEEQPHGTSPAH